MASVTAKSGKRRWQLPEALPAPGPVAMRIYVATWSLLLIAAIVLPVLGVWFDYQTRANPTWSPYGIGVNRPDGRLEISAVFGISARAAGLRPGDRIVAIDGQPLPPVLDLSAFRERVVGPEGMAKRFAIIPATGPPREVTLVRESRNTGLRFEAAGLSIRSVGFIVAATSMFTSALLVIAAVLLFRQRRRPVAALLSIAYLVLASFSLAGGLAANFLGINAETQPILAFGWGCLLLSIVAMPDGRFAPRWSLWSAAIVVLFWTIEGILRLPATISSVGSIFVTLIAVATLGLRYRALTSGPERQQLRWALLGFAWGSGLIILALTIQRLALIWAAQDFRWDTWGLVISGPIFALGLSAYALGLLVSLLRYRLYDADAAISRSAGYAVMTLLLAGVFGGSAKIIEWFVETSYGQDAGVLPGAIGAGLAVVLITPMHDRIHRWAERRFQKALLHLRRDLPDCVGDLRETASLGELLDEVLARVEAGTRAVRSEIRIDGKTAASRGAEGDFRFSVPLTIAHQQADVGTLLVGPRPDGSAPGKDERQALTEVADPIARAIRIVRTREAEKSRVDRQFERLEAMCVKAGRRPGSGAGVRA